MHPSQTPTFQKRHEPGRSATWPPTAAGNLRVEADAEHIHVSRSAQPSVLSPTPPRKLAANLLFENELNSHPEDHFLSPVQMYEFEDWADDSDDGDECVEWDAGITDFALFNDERRRAEDRNEDLPDRWQGFVASQASALQRAVERNRAHPDRQPRQAWIPLHDDLPQLTPDNSPDLRASFDIHLHCGQKNLPRLKATTLPEDDNGDNDNHEITYAFDDDDDGGGGGGGGGDDYDGNSDDDDDDDEDWDEDGMPVAYLVERARERRRQARKLEKPGMRFTHTLSGKVHVWQRPSRHIYDVDEDAAAERNAEHLHVTLGHETVERGRLR